MRQISDINEIIETIDAHFAALKGIWSHLSDQEVEQASKDLEKTRRRSADKIKRLADAIPEAEKE